MDTEHKHQAALFRWAEIQSKRIPKLSLLFAIPNGGLRSKATAAKLKAEGVKAGVPDICLPVAKGEYHGLFIELKTGGNKPTPPQVQWHMRLSSEGYRVTVCWGWEAAREAIEEYLLV